MRTKSCALRRPGASSSLYLLCQLSITERRSRPIGEPKFPQLFGQITTCVQPLPLCVKCATGFSMKKVLPVSSTRYQALKRCLGCYAITSWLPQKGNISLSVGLRRLISDTISGAFLDGEFKMHDRMSTTASEITDDVQVHRGLAGVYIDHTTICEIDNDTHKLRYRGYDIAELVQLKSFEEVVHLLLYGELPNAMERVLTADQLALYTT